MGYTLTWLGLLLLAWGTAALSWLGGPLVDRFLASGLFSFIELLIYCGLSMVSALILSARLPHSARGYRLAVLSSLLPGLVLWIVYRLVLGSFTGWWYLPVLLLGSLLGSFLVAQFRHGWYEDNYPPGEAVQTEILEHHRAWMGAPARLSPAKRVFDVLLSAAGLLLSSPLSLLIAFAIWWEDPGPVLFVKNSVGRGGHNFKQFKFRTMINRAEQETGPVLSSSSDRRVLRFGRFLRKTALDELPQLVNILRGEMSFVGPRPQRTVLVQGYLRTLPEYAQRHRVAPGLAGLAQVADHYSISPEEKLAWDVLYIQHASLLFDLKLLFLAFLLVFWLRWQKNGRPEETVRHWLKFEKPGGGSSPVH